MKTAISAKPIDRVVIDSKVKPYSTRDIPLVRSYCTYADVLSGDKTIRIHTITFFEDELDGQSFEEAVLHANKMIEAFVRGFQDEIEVNEDELFNQMIQLDKQHFKADEDKIKYSFFAGRLERFFWNNP